MTTKMLWLMDLTAQKKLFKTKCQNEKLIPIFLFIKCLVTTVKWYISISYIVWVWQIDNGIYKAVRKYKTKWNIVRSLYNINWRDVHIKNVANNVDMSCLREVWQYVPYTNKHLGQHETCRTTQRNRHLEQTMFVFFPFLFIFHIY